MVLKKALEKKREQESPLAEKLPVYEMLAMEIAHDQEALVGKIQHTLGG